MTKRERIKELAFPSQGRELIIAPPGSYFDNIRNNESRIENENFKIPHALIMGESFPFRYRFCKEKEMKYCIQTKMLNSDND